MDLRTALKLGIANLRNANVDAYIIAAEMLLLNAISRDRAWLYSHHDEPLTQEQAHNYFSSIDRRCAGEPTQHLTGEQEFWGLDFEVSRDVLIPRPETEHLIEVALDRLALREVRAGRPQKNTGQGLHIADVGTGSGCIAISLAKELPKAEIYATDISAAALLVARRNATRHAVSDRIHFIECNLLEIRGDIRPFNLVVSNPPYVGRRESHTLTREVREHEPAAALFGGEEGYEFYAELIAQAAQQLMPGGILVLELGYNSLPAVRLLLENSAWINVGTTDDLAGIPRVIAANRS